MSDISQDELKKIVRDYVDLENQITEANGALKTLKSAKSELGEKIIIFMEKNEVDYLGIKGGKLTRKVTKTAKGLNKEMITTFLISKLGDEGKAEKWLTELYEGREKVEKTTLKREKGGD